MDIFLQSFFAIAIAEMGDKTQLLAMGFATKFKIKTIIMGVFIGIFLNQLLAIIVGKVLATVIPINLVKIIAGVSFIIFALWTVRQNDDVHEGKKSNKSKFGPIISIALAFMLAELGDKTQLASVSLAAANPNGIMFVLFGTMLGMIVANAIGIIVGTIMGKQIPAHIIRWISVFIFAVFGVMTIIEPLALMIGEQKANMIMSLIIVISIIIGYIFEKQKHKKIIIRRG